MGFGSCAIENPGDARLRHDQQCGDLAELQIAFIDIFSKGVNKLLIIAHLVFRCYYKTIKIDLSSLFYIFFQFDIRLRNKENLLEEAGQWWIIVWKDIGI